MAKGEIFKGLPQWAQGAIAVAVVGGVGYIIYKGFKEIEKIQKKQSSLEEINFANKEANDLAKKGVKPTLTNAQLGTIVNGIKQSWLEYDAILRPHTQKFYSELVKVNNDLDMLNLINAYKTQKIDFPITKFTVNDFEGTLTQSAKNFLNSKEISAANNLLARKGIKYRF